MIPSDIGSDPIIVNTDLNGGPGVHWIVLYKLDDGSIYMYDPLGPKNKRMSSEGMPVDNLIPYDHIYPYSSQPGDSTMCGFFSIDVANIIKKLAANHEGLKAVMITRKITSEFGKKASKADMHKVEEDILDT